jgi:putative OPT family oligopeptide transporter
MAPQRPYREVTFAGLALGVVSGAVLTAAMSYAGLVIGFVVPASAIAAILGWGLLRGVLRRGSIVENNINQTVSSAINNTAGGIIFTFPALFLIEGARFNPWAIAAASIAGACLGTLFIIPLRKQMIDLERLPFPSGIAVAEVLRSPGAGLRKSALLGASTGVALIVGLLVSFGALPATVDLGAPLGLPADVSCTTR